MFFETQEERDKIIKDPNFLLVIKLLKEFFHEVRRYLFLIPILVLFGFLLIYKNAKTLRPTYTSDITFIITQQDKTKSNVLDELGFSSSKNNRMSINFDKLKMYGFSKKIITAALFRKMDFYSREDYCINHFMRLMAYPQKQPYFTKVVDVDSLNTEQTNVLSEIIGRIRGTMLSMSVGTGDVFMISFKSTNELFAYRFSKIYYETLKDFYIETALGSYYTSFTYFKSRLDSLSGALSGVEYSLANFDDRSHNTIKATAFVPRSNFERKRATLAENYKTALGQFELAKINYENAAPVYIILDAPSLPLPSDAPTARGQYMLALAGAFFLFFVVVISSILWKYFGFIFAAIIKS